MSGHRRRSAVAALAALAAFAAVLVGGGGVQAAPRAAHLSAVGDIGMGPNSRAVLAGMGASDAEAAVALGDLSYGVTGQEQLFCDLVTANVGEGYPFQLLAGNHESNGVNGNINDFSSCLPNQLPGLRGTYGRQWYVDHPADAPSVRLVMVSPALTFPDGAWSYAPGSPRYQWTSTAIDGARAAGIPWVVLGMHMPCVSVGQYTCASDVRALTDLAIAKDVDLVLNGHEHLYQRTKQLDHRPGCASLTVGSYNPACVSDSDDDLVKGAGTVVATVGTGGVLMRNVNPADPEAGYFRAFQGANTAAAYGHLDLRVGATTLSARFVPANGTWTDAFTIREGVTGPANQPPTARIAAPQCDALTCTFDGSGSTDPDGTVASYAWTFGDASTGTGARPTRTYGGSGTYPVTLTVTDDRGATATATTTVTVTAPGGAPLAADAFGRTLTGGWGAADVGGTWTVSPASAASVADGTGRLRMASAGAGPQALLGGVSATSTDLTATFSVDKPATGSGIYLGFPVRRVQGQDYRLKVVLPASGAARASFVRTASTGETAIGSAATLQSAIAAGTPWRVRVVATGTSPTTLRARVWPASQPEPTTWLLTQGDSTAALQAPGGIGLSAYLSSSATNAPVTYTVDDLRAVTP